MDEASQQKAASDASLKDFDCDTSLKLAADDKILLELPRKSSCDASDSDAVIEALNTNGIDKESEAPSGDNFPKNDSVLIQSQENTIQEQKSSDGDIHNESEVQLTVPSEELIDNSKKFNNNTDSEINSDLQSCEENFTKPDELCDDVSVCQEKDTTSAETTNNVLENQLIENIESEKDCSITNISEGSKPDEGVEETGGVSDVSFKENNREGDDERAEINPTAEGENETERENELVNCAKEKAIEVDEDNPLKDSVNKSEITSPIKEIINAVEITGIIDDEIDNIKTHKSDIEMLGDTDCSQVTLVDNQKSENIEGDGKENPLTQSVLNSDLHMEEKNSLNFLDENLKGKAGEGDLLLETEKENQLPNPKTTATETIEESTSNFELQSEPSKKTEEQCNSEIQSEVGNKIEDLSNSELQSETSNKTEEQCNSEIQSEVDNKMEEISVIELHSESKKKTEETSSSKLLCEIENKIEDSNKSELLSETANKIEEKTGTEVGSESENVVRDPDKSEVPAETAKIEEKTSNEIESELENVVRDSSKSEVHLEVENLIDDSSNHELHSEFENKVSDVTESITENLPMEIDLVSKVTIPLGEKTSNEADECKISQKHSEISIIESEKDNSDLGDKNSVQEYCSSHDVNMLNTSAEQDEEEEEEENNINRSENEGNEILDTEMVNCNEIEQIDLSESESDLKGEGRDEEMVSDSLETLGEKSNEEPMNDERETSGEAEKTAMLIDDEEVNEPGNSEEETITGDTANQPAVDMNKEKDEEICIIPDDVIPTILPQVKDVGTSKGENGGLTVLKVTPSETVKPKTRTIDKRSLDSKSRPVRNAAKLAGNKIKSLVESDLVFDENALSSNLVGDTEFQENTDESAQMCAQCREVKVCKLLSVQNDVTQYLCSEQCSAAFKAAQVDAEPSDTDNALRQYARKCGQCHSQITVDENRLFWETVDFCNEDCLRKYQLELGSHCANCKKTVPSTSLGKYCVRFGYDIKQFCSALCLEEHKKGLKVCSYCQKDISTGTEGFLAPVGNKGQFKDFCTQSCMEKYDHMSSNKPLPEVIEECAVCSNSKPVQVEVELDNKTHKLCSEPCFAAFKFVNNITEGQCDMCRKYFDRSKIPNYSLRLLFYDENLRIFCSKTCTNVYILANRKIVPCNWCKVKKYNFDMIKKASPDGQLTMMCSLNCLMLYQTSVNAVCSRPIKCDFCKKKFVRQPLYHLTMSDATLRNFCSYNCVMSFQNGYPKQKVEVLSGSDQLSSPIPTGGPKRIVPKRSQTESTCVPVISSVQSLASPNGPVSPTGRVQIARDVNIEISLPPSPVPAPPPQVYQQIITKPAPAKQMKNKSVLCKPYSHTKGVSCRPHPCMKETQTDQSLNRKFLIPIPVPIYVPAPMHMFATPFPVPVPFPLPVPVPIFIPTTRNSAKGIMKEIKKIQEKIPTDPFEAELLMMAEMVAGDKKQDPTDSESEDGNEGDDNGDGTFSPENVDTSNTFGDDMLQMALKMASELEEPAVDMESVLTSNTITTSTQPTVDPNKSLYASDTDDPDQVNAMAMNRGRKRSVRGSRNSSGGTPSKRGRRTSGSVDVPLLPPPEPVPPRTIEVEKPDANMCLKYTFGVNAWRHWVMQKNAELEKAALTNRKIKLFKPELLQLTADELNFSLCLFVKEVRKPNGTEYAPDTIYYLCLGIQQYLFENGRIDNIFTDSYYEKFTDCLDEVAKKFAALFNDSQYIVTRVEEEHLWESKQLGAHSPHVLLSTLMFFNTKHFNLVTVEEHMQLSFSHIMKHWKRNPNTPGVAKVPGSRNVLLRFYPPQSALEANSRKKKVYEQQENEENPLRCPVKLYEFYLSKCPESVKTRNDVFYLLPERSCVPDSPVWYSTMALGKEPLMKMLHRIKMVKEINIALLTS